MSTGTKELFGTDASFNQRTEAIEMSTVTSQPSANGALALAAPPANPMAIIQLAIERGVDPDQLGKLMDLQERYEHNRAAEEYGKAIAEFQKRCPRIHKSRDAKITSKTGGSYAYTFAGYDDVMLVAGPILADLGIAVSFSTESIEKGIRATIRLRKGIHFEDLTMDVPVPAMNVNDTQRYGAALQYVKRYLFCAALNIVVTNDVDDDGGSCLDPVDLEQEVRITELLESTGGNKDKFLKFMGVAMVSDIPAKDYQKAIDAINEAARKRNANR